MSSISGMDQVVQNQLEVVRRFQRVALSASEPGKDMDPAFWPEVRTGLASAVDKLATLVRLQYEEIPIIERAELRGDR